MRQVPVVSYDKVIKALKRGWVVVRQCGSHIRLQKNFDEEVLKLTVPAHSPIKKPTLKAILKQARLDLDRFLKLL